jgi:hypothetical protein
MDDIKKIISDLIYNEFDYVYCDTCRYDNNENGDIDPCEDCHRKYNEWAVSRIESDCIADKIIKELKV